MRPKSLPFLALLTFATALVVGCGDNNSNSGPSASPADLMYLKQKRIQEMYGGASTTATTTSTVVQYMTITNTTIVNQ